MGQDIEGVGSAHRRLGNFLDEQPFNRRHALVVATCSIAYMFDAMDFQIIALLAPSISKEWDLPPDGLGVILSSTVLGMLIGSYLFGTLADRIGRRTCFMITMGIVTVASGFSAFCTNPTELAIARFFTGLGIGGFTPIDAAVISEFLPARLRGRAITVTFLFFALGAFLAAAITTLGLDALGWRGLFLVGATPAIMVLLVRFLIPETPRFLLNKGRTKDAEAAASWVAADRPAPSLAGLGFDAAQPRRSAAGQIRELFSPLYRGRTIYAWSLWAFFLFSYTGILLWLPSLLVDHKGMPPSQVFPFMMGFLLSGAIGRLICSIAIERVGRKRMVAVATIGAGTLLPVFGMQEDIGALIFVGYIYAVFQDMGASAVTPLVPELYPTSLRTTGSGWAWGAGRLSAVFAPLLIGWLVLLSVTAVFAVIACGFFATAFVVLCFGRETSGLQLGTLEAEHEHVRQPQRADRAAAVAPAKSASEVK